MTVDDLLTSARAAIGTPFRHQGRTLRGMDCVGLLIHTCSENGVVPRDVEGYPPRPSNGLLEATFDAHVESGMLLRLPVDDLRPGNFLMMRFGREPQHLAICAGDTIVHSYMAAGKVCEHRLDARWRSRIIRVYRLAELKE